MPSIWCRSKKRGEADSEGAWSEARPSGGARCAPQTRPRRRESARASWPVRSVRSCTNSRSMQTCEEKLPPERQKIAGILCVFQDFLTQPGGNLGRKDVCWGLLVQLLRGKKRREADSEGAWTEARPSRGARCAPQTRPRRRESARASWPVRSVTGKKCGTAVLRS